ncbi:MAG: hydrogenase iron-sulfur subunit [Candidatus Korarchaeota archaeon]|nr:hydrogenase iron-sulfur subunit [Candidatus Korarchaeota archaeon]NIU84504.1 hydrogenase iron-sulfur subunit [Candidatus Thorarchaeota archaeon]NIW14571.1 hydrogenase iron-sulfur subunit [Candidatus Thorarchaeota archaeon]NIW52643.1 hydrogenase iron-sulfur subunit [Candidatus Korarchaeota archaeon]
MNSFEPQITAFLCKWCGYAGADMAGTSRIKYPATVVPIRFPCTGRIDAKHILKALNDSDGVLIAGCHPPNDCHYIRGNYQALKRFTLLKKFLKQMGVNPKRVRLEWVSATEGRKFANVVSSFTEELKELGPLNGHELEKETL